MINTGRDDERFEPGPSTAASTFGTLRASFRQDLMTCRPVYQKLWYIIYKILVEILHTTQLHTRSVPRDFV